MIKDIGMELRKLTNDDFEMFPKVFHEDDDPIMFRHLNWGMLFPNGVEEKPVYYMRNMEFDHYRWGGIVNLGDGPLEPQTEAHFHDLAQSNTKTTIYGKVEENPDVWGISSEEPFTEFRYTPDWATWKEGKDGSVFDLKATPFPMAFFTHNRSPYRIPYWCQQVTLEGTYEGKPVIGMGCFDRSFASTKPNGQQEMLDKVLVYLSGLYSCVREDGRRETCTVALMEKNGKGFATYWLEGEEPIITDEVWFEGSFYHLPYADKDDPTVTYKDCVWRFADKEVHYNAKWGSKGFLDKPRLETIGLSHSFGRYQIGSELYKQKVYHILCENTTSIDYRVKEMGLKVED